MIIATEVTVSWWHSNKEHYINKGYPFTKYKDKFVVNISDLIEGSKVEVDVKCDYCGRNITKTYANYLLNRRNLPKDCCNDNECRNKKREETFLVNYGVSHHMEIDEVKEKIKQTNLIKYGVENVFSNDAIKEKIAATNIEKYGVENPFKSEFIKEKIIQTTLNKYGKEYPMQVESVKNKMYQTKVKNGKNNFSSMFPIVNGVAASKPQVELGTYLNGKINAFIAGKFVDIYMESDDVAIEYDGGGHTLDIKRNRITAEEFYLKEKIAEERILGSVSKFIRIKNEEDVALSCEDISREIHEFLKTDSNSLLIKIS